MLKVIANRGSKELEMEAERLHDEIVTLKTAIEEAIRKGQRSTDGLYDISEFVPITSKDSAFTCMDAGSGVVGSVDDF
jgi:hypothetical protein